MNLDREQLVAKLGLQNSSKEVQDQILAQLYEAMENTVSAKVIERLSDEDAAEFDRLIKNDDEGAAEWFLKSKFENYDQFVNETLQQFIDEIAADIKSLNGAYADHANNPSSTPST